MNADLDPIIGKIKKCLSLSQSDNPHEAASALRQAQALMRKHGLDEVAMANAEVAPRAVGDVQTLGHGPQVGKVVRTEPPDEARDRIVRGVVSA